MHEQKRKRSTPLALDTLNANMVKAEYAVRGEIVQRAGQIARELEAGATKYPFDKILSCNIGNPQLLGQKPITFFRQVRCCAIDPYWHCKPIALPFGADCCIQPIAEPVTYYSESCGMQVGASAAR